METIIIEDEDFAARRLEMMLHECEPAISVLAKLQSVKDSVQWLRTHPHPDLIFLDIQLDDDLSFAIFDQIEVKSNIIFTTAFDEYAIKAFKLKSIDYLLKPISLTDLSQAIEKHKKWHSEKNIAFNFNDLKNLLNPAPVEYRNRFSVTVGDKLKSVDTSEIAYFYSSESITFLVTQTNRQYIVDMSLDNIMQQLDPMMFFRINRQYILSLKGIASVHVFPKSKLKIDLTPPVKELIFVSLDKVVDFKRWLDGEKIK